MSASASPVLPFLAPAPSTAGPSPGAPVARYLDSLWNYCCSVSAVTTEDRRERVTRFHSAWEPTTALTDYIITIARRARYSRTTVIAAFVLLSRYTHATDRRPSCLTVHRLFAVALLLAGKLHHDFVATNTTFAAAAGLMLEEMNQLEIGFATAINFDLFVSLDELNRMAHHLDAAASKSLRGDITKCVALAFNVRVPERPPPEPVLDPVLTVELAEPPALEGPDFASVESVGDYSSSRVFGSFAVFTRGTSFESIHTSIGGSMESSGRRTTSMARFGSHLRGGTSHRSLLSSRRGTSLSSMASSHRVTAASLLQSPETSPLTRDLAVEVVVPLPVFHPLFADDEPLTTASPLLAPAPPPPPAPAAPAQVQLAPQPPPPLLASPPPPLTARAPSMNQHQHFRRSSFTHSAAPTTVPTLPQISHRGGGPRRLGS